MERVGKFFGYFYCITANRYIFWPFSNLVAIWYLFPRFGIVSRKILATLVEIVGKLKLGSHEQQKNGPFRNNLSVPFPPKQIHYLLFA
jgi:hypothetical protein